MILTIALWLQTLGLHMDTSLSIALPGRSQECELNAIQVSRALPEPFWEKGGTVSPNSGRDRNSLKTKSRPPHLICQHLIGDRGGECSVNPTLFDGGPLRAGLVEGLFSIPHCIGSDGVIHQAYNEICDKIAKKSEEKIRRENTTRYEETWCTSAGWKWNEDTAQDTAHDTDHIRTNCHAFDRWVTGKRTGQRWNEWMDEGCG